MSMQICIALANSIKIGKQNMNQTISKVRSVRWPVVKWTKIRDQRTPTAGAAVGDTARSTAISTILIIIGTLPAKRWTPTAGLSAKINQVDIF